MDFISGIDSGPNATSACNLNLRFFPIGLSCDNNQKVFDNFKKWNLNLVGTIAKAGSYKSIYNQTQQVKIRFSRFSEKKDEDINNPVILKKKRRGQNKVRDELVNRIV